VKERPILFNGDMVRAIMSGAKTQTRRIYAGSPKLDGEIHPDGSGEKWTDWGKCPFGQPGDRLWVRETWGLCGYLDSTDWDRGSVAGEKSRPVNRLVEYRSDWNVEDGSAFWRPSIHMPRWASRITLEITAVRVERLQEITNQDAQAEGLPWACPHRHGLKGIEIDGESPDPYAKNHDTGWNDCWICAFKSLWNSIYGAGSWRSNPWVWVFEFKRVEGGAP
jgi:hypothetical protein